MNFCIGVKVLRSLCFRSDIQLFQHHLLERLSPLNCFTAFSKLLTVYVSFQAVLLLCSCVCADTLQP